MNQKILPNFDQSLKKLIDKKKSILYLGLRSLIINNSFSAKDSDIYTLFESSLREYYDNRNYIAPDCTNLFSSKNDAYIEKLIINIQQATCVFIEAPLIDAVERYIKRNKLRILEAFKSSAEKNICILPDIWPNIFFERKHLAESAQTFMNFSVDVSEYLSQIFSKKRFIVMPSIPIPKSLTNNVFNVSTEDFNNRSYDIIYFGTSKPIRNHFISQILKTAKTNGLAVKFICSDERGNFDSYQDYLREISDSRFYLCSRNNDYYVYPRTKLAITHKTGKAQYTGRASEAISVGTVPIYIEPRYTYSFRFIDSLLRKIYLRSGYKYKIGSPFDVPLREYKPFVATDSIANIYYTLNNPMKTSQLLEYGKKFFCDYIKPKSCFESLYCISQD